MRVHLDCIPCFQRQALQAARFVTNDELLQERILRKVIDRIWWMKRTATPPEMAHAVHRIVREETGVKDPYKDVKKRYNDIGLEIYLEMKQIVEDSQEPLFTAVRLAIAGNIIDFAAESNFDLQGSISHVLESDFAINDYQSMVGALEGARAIVYIADNTGEIVFDKLLLEMILDMYEIDRVLFAVKGAPIINDATIEDAEYVGIDKLPGMEFLKVDIGVPGTGMERGSKEFLDILDAADVVISKGQGNYEALSEHGGVFFLLMAKCLVVAEDLDVDVGSVVLKGAMS